MCGRFSQAQITELDREVFRLLSAPPLQARYNVAPTQEAAVIRQHAGGDRRLEPLRWGLIPSWARDPTIGGRMINARSETVAEKPAFRTLFLRRRCLIPADGFYEWKREGSRKQPYYIRHRNGDTLALAGLWDRWSDPTGTQIDTFTILTTAPNDLLRPIHNRMPVIIRPEHYDQWLDPDVEQPALLQPLLVPFSGEALTAYPVETYVNNPAHEGPRCIEPIER